MIKRVSGFCPTQNCQYAITLEYVPAGSKQLMQTKVICNYIASDFSKCPIYKECPIRNQASKTILSL